MSDTGSRKFYSRQAIRIRSLAIGGALALVGGGMLAWKGNEGVVPLAIGIAVVAWSIARGRRPLVTVEAASLVLQFAARRNIPFIEIARVDQLQSHDLELCLVSGAKLVIPMGRLEEDDATWLRKELRKEVRLAARRTR